MKQGFLFRGLVLGVCAVVLSGCNLSGLVSRNRQGALQVTAPQTFSVFLDDNFIGKTPVFDEHLQVGNYTLRAVSDDTKASQTWEAKITLSNRTLSVVNIIPESEANLLGRDIIELEPLPNKASILVASSLPDSVIVKLNQEVRGYTPLQLDGLPTGDFVLVLTAPGYKDAVLNLKATPGYKLKIQSNLARLKTRPNLKTSEASSSATTSSPLLVTANTNAFKPDKDGIIEGLTQTTEIKPPFVKILPAGGGINWLRVRKEASGTGNNEVAKVKANTYFPFKATSPTNEWYKIEYQPNKFGWVASRYASLTK